MNSKEINSRLNGSNLMNNNMNNNYRIESNSGLKASTLMNNNMNNNYRIESNSGLKALTLRNNKTMNNKYRITIQDTPVQNTSKTYVETPRMRRSTCLSEIKSGLKESALSNNKTMNNNRTYILDEPVPDIGVPTLSPIPFRRRVQSLKETSRKVVNKVKKKWNDFHDWIIDYVPPAIRVNPSSAIEKLKNHIRKLYQQSTDFTPVEKKAAKGYFKTFTITW